MHVSATQVYSIYRSRENIFHLFLVVLVGQSVWDSQEHREARTLKLLCGACPSASRTTPLSVLSLTSSASVNSVPWQQTARRGRAPVAFWHPTTAWSPVWQHRRAPTTPTAAHGTPVAPQEDPGPTCLTACRSLNLWKVTASFIILFFLDNNQSVEWKL